MKQQKLKNIVDLYNAYYDCRCRKRRKLSALDFELFFEHNLEELYNEIITDNYNVGRCICFVVTRPKPREVWAANFRDRIVHHLVYNFIAERFYKRFIHDTYSCIPGRGTLYAALRLEQFMKSATNNFTKPAFYLKADLSNFFISIDKNILFHLLKLHITEPWILYLLEIIIFHDHASNVFKKSPEKKFALIPQYKSLFNAPKNKGLPIGNLTSQFFSNVYLDVMDKFIKETLHCKYYVRYVDDFIIIDDSAHKLNEYHKRITDYIFDKLLLTMHPKKKLINKVTNGAFFLGHHVKPNHLLLSYKTINKFDYVIDDWLKSRNKNSPDMLSDFMRTANSYYGMMSHINGYNTKKIWSNKINSEQIYADEHHSKLILSNPPSKNIHFNTLNFLVAC